MKIYEYFELHRAVDSLIYQFDRKQTGTGQFCYKRRDADLWITYRDDLGWVAWDETTQSVMGRPWNTLPAEQSDHPPEGEWVSKKGDKSYVYHLRYSDASTP